MRQVGTRPTRKAARRLEAQELHRPELERETVREFAARWLEDFPRPKASTNVTNRQRTARFAAQMAGRRMDQITVRDALDWARAHQHDVDALRSMFNDARRTQVVETNPFERLGLNGRRVRQLAPEWLSLPDVLELAAVGRRTAGTLGAQMEAMILTTALTGLRTGELLALRYVDLGATTLHVRRAADSKTRTVTLPKNGSAREVAFPRLARDVVARLPKRSELVFPGKKGQQLWASTFSWWWRPVKAAFGRPDMDFYELRHFCATRLLEIGLSPADVAQQLGHTDGGALVMRVYGHPSERAARARILAAVDGHGDTAPVSGLREAM